MSTQPDSLVVQVIAQVKELLKTLPELDGKVIQVYSEDEMKDATKGVNFPCVAIVYEGMRAIPEDKPTMRQGVSAELVLSLLITEKVTTAGESKVKNRTINLLDLTRKAMHGGRSPAGHKWRFVLEAPASEKQGSVIWLQRWSTPIQLVP